jgi:hypothetical protein
MMSKLSKKKRKNEKLKKQNSKKNIRRIESDKFVNSTCRPRACAIEIPQRVFTADSTMNTENIPTSTLKRARVCSAETVPNWLLDPVHLSKGKKLKCNDSTPTSRANPDTAGNQEITQVSRSRDIIVHSQKCLMYNKSTNGQPRACAAEIQPSGANSTSNTKKTPNSTYKRPRACSAETPTSRANPDTAGNQEQLQVTRSRDIIVHLQKCLLYNKSTNGQPRVCAAEIPPRACTQGSPGQPVSRRLEETLIQHQSTTTQNVQTSCSPDIFCNTHNENSSTLSCAGEELLSQEELANNTTAVKEITGTDGSDSSSHVGQHRQTKSAKTRIRVTAPEQEGVKSFGDASDSDGAFDQDEDNEDSGPLNQVVQNEATHNHNFSENYARSLLAFQDQPCQHQKVSNEAARQFGEHTATDGAETWYANLNPTDKETLFDLFQSIISNGRNLSLIRAQQERAPSADNLYTNRNEILGNNDDSKSDSDSDEKELNLILIRAQQERARIADNLDTKNNEMLGNSDDDKSDSDSGGERQKSETPSCAPWPGVPKPQLFNMEDLNENDDRLLVNVKVDVDSVGIYGTGRSGPTLGVFPLFTKESQIRFHSMFFRHANTNTHRMSIRCNRRNDMVSAARHGSDVRPKKVKISDWTNLHIADVTIGRLSFELIFFFINPNIIPRTNKITDNLLQVVVAAFNYARTEDGATLKELFPEYNISKYLDVRSHIISFRGQYGRKKSTEQNNDTKKNIDGKHINFYLDRVWNFFKRAAIAEEGFSNDELDSITTSLYTQIPHEKVQLTVEQFRAHSKFIFDNSIVCLQSCGCKDIFRQTDSFTCSIRNNQEIEKGVNERVEYLLEVIHSDIIVNPHPYGFNNWFSVDIGVQITPKSNKYILLPKLDQVHRFAVRSVNSPCRTRSSDGLYLPLPNYFPLCYAEHTHT